VVATSTRASKKARTKAELAAATLALTADRGFDGATIDEITARAEVGRRTFFRYFESKEAALFEARRLQLEAFEDALAESPEPAFDAVKGTLLALAKTLMLRRVEEVALHRMVMSSPSLIAYDRKLDLDFESAIEAHLAATAKTIAAKRTAKITAAALMGVVRAVSREWLDDGGKGDLVRRGRDAFELLERGLVPRSKPARTK